MIYYFASLAHNYVNSEKNMINSRTGMVVRLNVHWEDGDGVEQIESVSRVLPGRYSVLNLSPKVSIE